MLVYAFWNPVFVFLKKFLSLSQVKNISSIKEPVTANCSQISIFKMAKCTEIKGVVAGDIITDSLRFKSIIYI